MLLLIILIHIACLAWLLFGPQAKKQKLNKGTLLFALLLPIFGSLSVLVIRSAEKEATVKSSKDDHSFQLTNELTSNLNVSPAEASSIVPLEDALIMDSSVQRRSLIMNVLNDEPANYLDILKEAQRNDDGEVVHYATTALSEQFSLADRRLQLAERAHQTKPEDKAASRALADSLREYIALGSAQGAAARARQEEYAALLEGFLAEEPRLEDAAELCRTYMALNAAEKAEQVLDLMEEHWPRSEERFLLGLEYAWSKGRSGQVKALLAKAREGSYILSQNTLEQLSVWLH